MHGFKKWACCTHRDYNILYLDARVHIHISSDTPMKLDPHTFLNTLCLTFENFTQRCQIMCLRPPKNINSRYKLNDWSTKQNCPRPKMTQNTNFPKIQPKCSRRPCVSKLKINFFLWKAIWFLVHICGFQLSQIYIPMNN